MTSPTNPGYISLPISIDDDQLLADALDYIAAQYPGWTPRDGHLEVWLLQAVSRMVAQRAQVDAQASAAIFAYFGSTLLGLAANPGAAANVTVQVTCADTTGHTLPKGTVLAYPAGAGNNIMFSTATDITIGSGSSTGTATAVCTTAGAFANGLAPATCVLVEPQSFVSSVVSTTTSTGGADAETMTAYLNRLTANLRLLAPRPILATDYAAMAQNVDGVYRATALDNFDPAEGPGSIVPRTVTVAGVDSSGAVLSDPVKLALTTYLTEQREINFAVWVIDPTYTTLDVTATITVRPDANAGNTTAACITALRNYLSPANWGGGNLTPPQWVNKTVVRYLELAAVVGAVDGVDDVVTVTVGPHSGTQNAADLTLPGSVPLTQAGTISVTPA